MTLLWALTINGHVGRTSSGRPYQPERASGAYFTRAT